MQCFRKKGYNAIWTILNSADFGVPQIRERVFVIAIKKDENFSVCLPVPTHKNKDDKLTPNQMRFKAFSECPNFQVPVNAPENAEPWVTVGEAINDLPRLFKSSHEKYMLNRIDLAMSYSTEEENCYQHLMRTWYEDNLETVTGNCFRKTLKRLSDI